MFTGGRIGWRLVCWVIYLAPVLIATGLLVYVDATLDMPSAISIILTWALAPIGIERFVYPLVQTLEEREARQRKR